MTTDKQNVPSTALEPKSFFSNFGFVENPKIKKRLAVLAGLLALAIFLTDLSIPLGVAGGSTVCRTRPPRAVVS